MGYIAIAMCLLCFFFGITGKNPPFKRPSLIELPRAANRAIYFWMALVFTGFGVLLTVAAHRR